MSPTASSAGVSDEGRLNKHGRRFSLGVRSQGSVRSSQGSVRRSQELESGGESFYKVFNAYPPSAKRESAKRMP